VTLAFDVTINSQTVTATDGTVTTTPADIRYTQYFTVNGLGALTNSAYFSYPDEAQNFIYTTSVAAGATPLDAGLQAVWGFQTAPADNYLGAYERVFDGGDALDDLSALSIDMSVDNETATDQTTTYTGGDLTTSLFYETGGYGSDPIYAYPAPRTVAGMIGYMGQFTYAYSIEADNFSRSYDFGGDQTSDIVQGLEYDGTAVLDFAQSFVPEPASWALMIAGFGLAGATLRRRRRLGLRGVAT
jgi:hypothetical protein